MRTILYPKWLVDGVSLHEKENTAVVISGNRIDAVLPAGEIQFQPNDVVIKLDNQTVMPGLINNHVHTVLLGNKTPFPMSQLDSEVTMTLRAANNIKLALHSGVTMVRECGGKGTVTTELRDAQKSGTVEGSRMFCSGWPITITGGHVRYFGGEADGIEGLTRMVRKVVGVGADFVKVMASGGGTPGSMSNYPAYTLEEMSLIVRLSHDFGKLVAAHCIATASIEQAIDAGVDMIEHALFIAPDQAMTFDDRVAEKLAKSKIPVTTTLCPFSDALETSKPGLPEFERWSRMLAKQYEFFAKMKKMDITLLAGSDAGWLGSPFTGFWKELYELTCCGLTPVEAIIAATRLPAETLRLDQDFGTVVSGKVADLTVVNGNIAKDILFAKQIHSVFQDGKLVVHNN